MVDDVVRTVLVAVLLGVGLVGALGAAGWVPHKARVSAYAGFLAGVFLVGMLDISFESTFRASLTGFLAGIPEPLAAVCGGIAGILVIALFVLLRENRAVGMVFIAQTVIAGGGLLLLFRLGGGPGSMEAEARTRIALLAVGAAIGVCLAFLTPRRVVDGYERWRADRDAIRREARSLHQRSGTRASR